MGDPVEKARTAVTRRIRSAVKKIGEAHPELGRHFEVSVRTGTFCAYTPDRQVAGTSRCEAAPHALWA
jgi:hypothetical protein